MPIIVPIEENHEGIASLTDTKFRAPDYSGSGLEALGAGLTKVGESGAQFATALDEKRQRKLAAIAAIAAAKLDNEHQSHIDDAAVKKAYIDYSNQTHEALHGDDGLFNQQGANAHVAFPSLVEKLVDNHDTSLSKLDDIQRAAVAPAMNQRLRSDVERAADFVRQQGGAEQKWQSAQLQKAAARDAVFHADDPDLFDHHLATGENAIRQQGRIMNLPDEEIDRQIADYRLAVHAATIEPLADPGTTRDAGPTGAPRPARALSGLAAGDDAVGPGTPIEGDASGNSGAGLWENSISGGRIHSGLIPAAFTFTDASNALEAHEAENASPPPDVGPDHVRTLDDIIREIVNPREPSAPKPAGRPANDRVTTTVPAGNLQRSWPIPGYWGRKAGQTPLGGDRDDHRVVYSDGSFHLRPPFKRGKAHKGDDLPGPVNVPIHAAADGVVVAVLTEPKGIWDWATDRNGKLLLRKEKPYKVRTTVPGTMDGYGHCIKIRHPDGYTTLYGHLRDVPPLKVGTRVTMGQQIGILGKTGNAATKGSHVHFEVQGKSGHPIDPALWINGHAPLIK